MHRRAAAKRRLFIESGPLAEQGAEIVAVDDAVAVEVGGARGAGAPLAEQGSKIVAVDDAVLVEIGRGEHPGTVVAENRVDADERDRALIRSAVDVIQATADGGDGAVDRNGEAEVGVGRVSSPMCVQLPPSSRQNA